MIHFQVGDEVRVVGVPADEWCGASGAIVKTVERVSDDHADEFVQECAVQFAGARRWFSATHLVRAVPNKAVRFFRGEVLQRWGDLSLEDVVVLNGKRDELMGLLQERYGFSLKRAGTEVDDFLSQLQERIRLATDVTDDRKTAVHTLKIPA
jgi:uncharacterized protein YjbJ (UPF0337 family)